MTSIIETLRRNVDLHPEKIFCHFRAGMTETPLTYERLWAASHDYAASLAAAGVQSGEVVIIMLRHREALYASFIGAMIHGAIPSFMPCPSVKQRADVFWPSHQKLFARIRPTAFIAEPDLIDAIRGIVAAGTPIIDFSEVAPSSSANHYSCDSNGVAFLQHSSGTTGTKKGVMLSHRAVLDQVYSYTKTISFDRDAVIASWLPLYHDMGLIACLFTPMICGATVVHMDALEWTGNPLALLDIIETHRATHVWLPNFAFNHMAINRRRARDRQWDLSSLRMAINCSEPCKVESMDAFVSAYADCGITAAVPQVCYAMAENVFAVTQTDSSNTVKSVDASIAALLDNHYVPGNGSDIKRIPSCGRTIPDVEVRIAGPDNVFLSDGKIGEIYIRGSCLFEGYHLLEAETARKMYNGWYRTGDLGFLHQGELYVTGRVDDLIIVRGRNFYAHDIEAIVSTLPGVKPGRSVVFSVDNDLIGTRDVVCLAEGEGADVDPIALRRLAKTEIETQCGLMLAKFELYPVGTLVKTTSGKISREMNMKLFVEGKLMAGGTNG